MKIPLSEYGKEYKEKASSRYLLYCLIAVELFMSFSSVGYIHIEPISLTFVYIPVLIAGCLLGTKESIAVAAVFGLASMWKASAFYIGDADSVFSPFMSGKPLQSILLSVGSRAFFGLLTGLLYKAVRRAAHPLPGIIIVSSLGRTMHAFCVYLFMQLLFPETGMTVADTVSDLKRWDYIPTVLIIDGIMIFCYLFRKTELCGKFVERIRRVDRINSEVEHGRRIIAFVLVIVLLASASVVVYFIDRIGSVMDYYGFSLSDQISYDLTHLQIQLMLGMIALSVIVILVITLHQKNFNYLYYEARLDGLTGLLGRKQFFQEGQELLRDMDYSREGKAGCFFILDIDHFKEVNDRYGHPAGDRVLREIAVCLRRNFGNMGILGRLGGDEFVGLIVRPVDRKEIAELLAELRRDISGIRVRGEKITCSTGVIPVEKDFSIDKLYRNSDRLLYEAKKKGKDQYVLGYRLRDQAECPAVQTLP